MSSVIGRRRKGKRWPDSATVRQPSERQPDSARLGLRWLAARNARAYLVHFHILAEQSRLWQCGKLVLKLLDTTLERLYN